MPKSQAANLSVEVGVGLCYTRCHGLSKSSNNKRDLFHERRLDSQYPKPGALLLFTAPPAEQLQEKSRVSSTIYIYNSKQAALPTCYY